VDHFVSNAILDKFAAPNLITRSTGSHGQSRPARHIFWHFQNQTIASLIGGFNQIGLRYPYRQRGGRRTTTTTTTPPRMMLLKRWTMLLFLFLLATILISSAAAFRPATTNPLLSKKPQRQRCTIVHLAAETSSANDKTTKKQQQQPGAATLDHPHGVSEIYPPKISIYDNSNDDDDDDDNNMAAQAALAQYQAEYQTSIDDPDQYWQKQAYEYLDWEKKFDSVRTGSFTDSNHVAWFTGGKLNACYNAIDRHVNNGRANQIAMIWEGDEPTKAGDHHVVQYTYAALQQKVSQIAHALIASGVQKGDVVTIYMGMVPELPMTMLACARIGAIHSVVFAGFSADALAVRIVAAQSKVLVTNHYMMRAGKRMEIKRNVVDVARQLPGVDDVLEKVLVWESFGPTTTTSDNADSPTFDMLPKDVRMELLVQKQRPYCPVVTMDAEDPLFILYTSGSTGTPKGLVHTTAGYSLYAAFTTKRTFDFSPDHDIFACVADCGWYVLLLFWQNRLLFRLFETPVHRGSDAVFLLVLVLLFFSLSLHLSLTLATATIRITGHTYTVYGPLLNGGTTVLFASTPLYPDAGRYWDLVDRHKVTVLYTAPTAIRSLMRYGDTVVTKYNLSSLRILGSVGEPINPAAWKWYYNVVGRQKCTVVDTYWQTETGGHVITNLPGITPMIPGSCTLPMYGIVPVVLDPVTGVVQETSPAEGVLALAQPWPGLARTILGDHERYETTYLRPYPGYYTTGDACYRDENGNIFITGRVDDVLNVSGHRIGTAEVESALVAHPAVAQAAVVGRPHAIKGQGIVGFCTLKADRVETPELLLELKQIVRTRIGPFAQPDQLWTTPALPMTRSGKIMRRILRKIVAGETDGLGDTSTLADPSVVEALIAKVLVVPATKK
jgi:acetyl-CoA synthetase